MKRPNFFIIGAPKCGTTSLSDWLAEHPEIFLSPIKEPHFFSADDLKDPSHIKKLEKYERLFKNANEKHKAVGEASTLYLYSPNAVPKILKFTKEPKFIVCLRNPIDMVPSLHSQRVKGGMETEISLPIAWELQGKRRQGEAVPITCPDPKYLLYGATCLIGEQFEKLISLVSRDRIHAILLEDMKANPGREYRRALEFLGITDDKREYFPVRNVRKIPLYPKMTKAARILANLKGSLGIRKGLGILRIINALNSREPAANNISTEMNETLKEYFQDDIKKLSRLLERDLTHWLK